MVFNSAIFLFAFLPVLYGVYRLAPGARAKNAVLLVFSLAFYCFGGLRFLPVLLLSILVNWGAGRILGALPKTRKSPRRLVMILTAVLDLGALAAYKYLGFLAGTLNALTGASLPVLSLGLPLGISFFTFTGLGYVIEVYRKPANMEKSLFRTALFISLFPNLLSGPILSWRTAAPQLEERTCTPEKTAAGLRRFIVGLSKKLLIADIVAGVADAAYGGGALNAGLAWLGTLAYAVQIYFDFSGYSDMALGLASVFGFDFPENFAEPYTALGMTDFWKRWHISLTTWFRNYLYMPMVMSKPLQRLYKRWAGRYGRPRANKLAILIPSAVVWLLTGLWHGASWSYILWGLWHGLFCVLEGVGLLPAEGLKRTAGGRVLLRLYTILVILMGTVLFRAGTLSGAGRVFAAMFTGFGSDPAAVLALQQCVTGLSVFCLLAGLAGSAGVLGRLRTVTGRWGEGLSYVLCLGLLVLCIMSMAVNGFQPFIYLQF